MKKLIGTITFLGAVCVWLWTSNPKVEAHKSALVSKLSETTDNSLAGKAGSMLTGALSEFALDKTLEYHNYLLFSTTKIKLLGKEETATFGIFGHVFTMVE